MAWISYVLSKVTIDHTFYRWGEQGLATGLGSFASCCLGYCPVNFTRPQTQVQASGCLGTHLGPHGGRPDVPGDQGAHSFCPKWFLSGPQVPNRINWPWVQLYQIPPAKRRGPAHLCIDSAITEDANYARGAGEAEVGLSQCLPLSASREGGDQSFRSSEGPWPRPGAVRENFQGK